MYLKVVDLKKIKKKYDLIRCEIERREQRKKNWPL